MSSSGVMQHIGTVVVPTGSTDWITFSSIPQTFQHLVVRMYLRGVNNAANAGIYLTVNGQTGTPCSHQHISETGAFIGTNSNVLLVGTLPLSQNSANNFGITESTIFNYRTTLHKTIFTNGIVESNTTSTIPTRISTGTIRTTVPVDTVIITTDNGAYLGGSTASLYGILV